MSIIELPCSKPGSGFSPKIIDKGLITFEGINKVGPDGRSLKYQLWALCDKCIACKRGLLSVYDGLCYPSQEQEDSIRFESNEGAIVANILKE